MASLVWRWSLPLGFAPGSHVDGVRIDPSSEFTRFLASLAGIKPGIGPTETIPPLVILAGNPHAPAPRYLVQVFDGNKRPVAVVKTGIGLAAAELINREVNFLEATAAQQGRRLAIPKVLGRFAAGQLCGFAMQFIGGTSPRPSEADGIAPILGSWLDRTQKMRVGDLAAWKRLAHASAGDQLFGRLNARLATVELHPALFHGDFVPWNIKVSPGESGWTVLDWERGERQGPPGWDWFHYVIQSAMLVEKKTGSALTRAAEEMLATSQFRAYGVTSGLAGREHDWLLAYLLHCRDVLRPREGSRGVDTLLAGLTRSSR